MMRVLHVEDDAVTAQSVALLMQSEGFNVYNTELGEEGADLAHIYDYDLILLDLGLPDISGLEVLRRIRVARVKTPVMIVSGQGDVETKVKAFTAGADDYLVKPFHKDELVARSLSIVRRSKGHAEALITAGPIVVNLDAKYCSVAGRQVYLTGKEYRMLELLALRIGQTITKEMFLNHLYGGMDEPEVKIIDVFICKIRTKLRAAGGNAAGHLQTVWGSGYRLLSEPGQDRPQRAGTSASMVGQTLARLAAAPGQSHRRADIAKAMSLKPNQVLTELNQLREKGFVESQGAQNAITWSITAAGIEENSRRHLLAAA